MNSTGYDARLRTDLKAILTPWRQDWQTFAWAPLAEGAFVTAVSGPVWGAIAGALMTGCVLCIWGSGRKA